MRVSRELITNALRDAIKSLSRLEFAIRDCNGPISYLYSTTFDNILSAAIQVSVNLRLPDF